MSNNPAAVTKGVRFRSHYADSNPLWEARTPRGAGVWICEVVSETFEVNGTLVEGDYVGTTRAFTEEEILASVGMAQLWDELGQAHDAWWSSLPDGATVHYERGRDSFVRGVVVRDAAGAKKMRPTALVGSWWKGDLPSYAPDGTPYLGYHAEQIAAGELMQPNHASMYESPSFAPTRSGLDPRTLPPIDLALPEPTPEQAQRFARERVRRALRAALELPEVEDALARVKEIAATL